MLKVREITSRDEMRTIQPAWEGLLQQDGAYTPFLSSEWISCCLTAYGQGKEPFLLVFSNEAGIVAIAPLWRYRETIRGIGVRKVGFISGRDTPFVDFVICEGMREETLEALIDYLFMEKKRTWDVLSLNQWAESSPNCETMQRILLEKRKRAVRGISSLTPYLPIRGDWEEFLKTRSTRFRKTHRNIMNRIEKLKNVEVVCFREDTSGSLLRNILAVSEKSWKGKEGIAISSEMESRQFFEALTDVAGKKGWLKVWLLTVDGTPIAMEYDLEYDGTVYALRADFDEAYKDASPGAYLEYMLVQKLFDEGYKEYNTGPGLNTYKLQWTDKMRTNVGLHAYNNNVKGYTLWALEHKLIPFLRRIREKVVVSSGKEG
jgi:CelD/BcsL family acetyltransferase involved in cellulose biosynthesis